MIRSKEYIYCPYCGKTVSLDNLDDTIDSQEEMCPHCKNEIHLEIEWKPIIKATKMEQRCCLECGTEVKMSFLSFDVESKVRKYMDIPDDEYCLCHKCNTKLKMTDVSGDAFNFMMRKRYK